MNLIFLLIYWQKLKSRICRSKSYPRANHSFGSWRKDVIGQAQTGTGKTAALFANPWKIRTEEATIQALVIAPTRELAVQSQEELFRFGRSKGVKVRSVYGGSSIEKQIKGS